MHPPAAGEADPGTRLLYDLGLKYKADELTLDTMVPVFKDLEQRAVDSEARAKKADAENKELKSQREKLVARVQLEVETRLKNDAKMQRLEEAARAAKAEVGKFKNLLHEEVR